MSYLISTFATCQDYWVFGPELTTELRKLEVGTVVTTKSGREGVVEAFSHTEIYLTREKLDLITLRWGNGEVEDWYVGPLRLKPV